MSPVVATLIVASLVTAVALAIAPLTVDEGWFLQVCRRVSRGDRLYEDVFYGAGPVPVWVCALAFRLARPQGLVVRALSLVYTVAMATAAAWTVHSVGRSALLSIAAGLLVVALAGRQVAMHNHYGLITTAAFIAAAGATLNSQWWLVGLLLGLATTAKYPAGIAGAALLAPAAFWSGGLAAIAAVALGWTLVLGVASVIMRRQSLKWFLERAVRNKRLYLERGRMDPMDGMRRALQARPHVLARITTLLAYVVAPVSVVVAGVTLVHEPGPVSAVQTGLAGFALFSWFPRADLAHVSVTAAPAAASLGIAIALAEYEPGFFAVAATGILVLLSLMAAFSVRPSSVRRDLPSFRHVPVPKRRGPWPDETKDLIDVAGRDVFLLGPDAALFYASGGIRNPTPFDYPFINTFGTTGQSEVIDTILTGAISHVCVGPPFPVQFAPGQLLDFVSSEMTKVADTKAGSVWAAPAERRLLDDSTGDLLSE